MHVGLDADEAYSLEKIRDYIKENGLREMTGLERKHHEIYLSTPRCTAPENLKKVLRLPVEQE